MRLQGLLPLALMLLPTDARAACICLKCALPQYEMFQAVSSSMAPGIEAGDCVVATLVDPAQRVPQRGDVIVFRDEAVGSKFIYRVIGLPGDRVALRKGVVWLDNMALPQMRVADYSFLVAPQGPQAILPRCPEPAAPGKTCQIAQFRETLPSGRSYSVLDMGDSPLDTTVDSVVPPGHVFVLGDNRDNAADSRLPAARGGRGLIAVSDILGIFEDLTSGATPN